MPHDTHHLPPDQHATNNDLPQLQRVNPSDIHPDDEYEVEAVVDHRMGKGKRRGQVEYRVRWKDYPPDQDS